jgi:hypothetical protein
VKDELNDPLGGLRVSRVAGRLQFWGLESVCIHEREEREAGEGLVAKRSSGLVSETAERPETKTGNV